MTTRTDLHKRSDERRKRIVTHKSHGHEEAERWNLAFWQKQGPEARLSALIAIREDVRKVEESRRN